MKNRNVLKAVAAAILTLSGGLAGATGTQDLTVTATISTICRFTTGSAISIPFGTIDPSTTGAKTANISVPYKCTKGTVAPGVQVTVGGTTLTGVGGTTMAYTLSSFPLWPAWVLQRPPATPRRRQPSRKPSTKPQKRTRTRTRSP